MNFPANRRVAPFFGAALSLLGLVAALPSQAADPVVVVIVDGPGGDALADQVTKDKLGGVDATVRAPKSVPCKLAAAKGPKGKARTALDACLRKTVDADAIVLVVITKGPKGRVADVRVVARESSTTTTEAHVTLAAKPAAADATKVKDAIEPALAPYAAKAKSTPTTTADTTTTATTTPSAKASTSADAEDEDESQGPPEPKKKTDDAPHPNAPRMSVAIGAGIGARSFAFKGASGPTLRPYSLSNALLLGVAAEGYPGDDGEGVRFRPGIAFAYTTTSGLESETEAGRTIGTTWTRFDIGLRGRLALGGDRSPVITLGVGMTREAFVFVESEATLPGAVYWMFHGSLGARVPLGPVAVLGEFGVLPAFRLSGATDPFRQRSGVGLEGMLGLALPFARNFDLRWLASHTRYSTKFVAAPVSTAGATGATDSYTRLQVFLAFLY